jgi:protein-S-isoprenylcysteine O-methyltransferase Ste14
MPEPLRLIYELWALWAVTWVLAAAWSGRTATRVPLAAALPYRALQLTGAVLLLATEKARFRIEPDALRWAMAALVGLGFLFCWWARLHLGRLWSGAVERKEGHRVVDTGPYRLVRHPIYTGLILAGFATAIARGGVAPMVGAFLLALAWWLKAQLEERLLRDELGAEAYEAYAARTPMLLPLPKV